MEYVVMLGLLSLVGAGVAAVYARLRQLRARVVGAWKQQDAATRRRNECLLDFAAVLAGYLPQEDMMVREMRRLAEDSGRALNAAAMPLLGMANGLNETEQQLQRSISHAARAMEAATPMLHSEQLLGLYHALAVSCRMQEEAAQAYNRSVVDFNAVLDAPMPRLLAPLLGFSALDELATPPREQV